MSMRKRLLFLLATLTAAPALAVIGMSYYQARTELINARLAELETLTDLKANSISEFHGQLLVQLDRVRHNPAVREKIDRAMVDCADAGSPRCEEARRSIDRQLGLVAGVSEFSDFLVIRPDGVVIYDSHRIFPDDLAGTTADGELARAFELGRQALHVGEVCRDLSGDDLIRFRACPVRSEEGGLLAVLIMATRVSHLFNLVQNYTGLGRTGETLVGKLSGNTVTFLNPLRHDPRAAFTRKVALGSAQAIPVQLASRGKTGSGESVDYRGVPILAAWRYVDPPGWGIVAKIDRDEALAGLRDLRKLCLELAVVFLLLSLLAGIFMANRLAAPVLELRRAVETVGEGDLTHRIDSDRTDELGDFARDFDRMTERLQAVTASRNDLEREVQTRNQAQRSLRRANRVLQTISECNQVLVRAESEERLFEKVCETLVHTGGYSLAWIGIPRDDPERTVEAVQGAGPAKDYLAGLQVSWGENEFGSGPTGRAVRTGRVQAMNDLGSAGPEYEPWRERAARFGFQSSAAIPLSEQNRVLAVLNVYSSDAETFDEDELRLLGELADDVAYGVSALRARRELKRADADLRRSQQRYELITENMTDTIWLMDLNFRPTFITPSVTRTRGYTLEELQEMPFNRQLTPPSFEAATRIMAEQMTPERLNDPQVKISQRLELEFLTKDGSPFWAEAEITLLRDEEGRPLGFLGSARDINQRKALEEQLLHSQKLEAVGRLAGGVAHDFNNHLTVIMAMVGLLINRTPQGSPEREDLEDVASATEKAAAVTRQLLAFSRKQVMKPESISINEVIEDSHKILIHLLGEDVELKIILEPDLKPVFADAGQFEQIVVNLAVNARDAMPQGGVLTMETANVEVDETYASRHFGLQVGPHVRLTVTDTGMGISPRTLPHIFEPFFTTKDKGKGTGMGLAMVYGIVKQSGGDIWVYSEPGMGSTFKIFFPVAAAGRTSRRIEAEPSVLTGRETILVVEDDPDVRKAAARTLTGQGYLVIDAATGVEALGVIKSYNAPIDLIVTDVIMPGMNGRQLVDRIRGERPDLKALFISGYTDNVIAHHGVLDPGIDFLEKPFNQEALLHKVRMILDRRN